ncbi:MarR family winged helix-turn-helix transcriptional regulator [Compostimonas suwonensis]|uniref:DNA-binding MarR family transcriptional regulator n=1 Tax=Compostimonas suwonensis TaxID=1048394 RepID=A0A2M9BTX6_9MICO|nr:MarR family winged helix-turn-helix transcriptional regulator [Compostimonas suwonensis]PJJ61393.1 DNA-binding MarR family transcriptional regulator [Compostimonas suwonensis]
MEKPGRLSADEQEVWDSFFRMRRHLDRALDEQLSKDANLSYSDYEVLIALLRAPERRARVRDLVATIRWEKSRVSHHVTRMEKRGLVERRPCDTDARASFIHLTTEGRRAVVKASPRHVDTIRALFFDQLTPEQLESLGAASRSVLGTLDACDPGDDSED